MLRAEYVKTDGWEAAVRGMRNPMNSWAMSDSEFEPLKLGERDLGLMKTLVSAGSDHGKFMRMIDISMDIVAPEYWWAQFDTYHIGVTRNSCSKMHKLTEKPFTADMFSTDMLFEPVSFEGSHFATTLKELNYWRDMYLKAETPEAAKIYWYTILQQLPMSYNQRSTVTLNYEVARRMYHARKNHKLSEWHELCRVFEGLPYAELITMECGKHGT